MHQVPLLDVGGDVEVQALRLIDIGCAIGREFEQPALVDFEAGLVHAFSSGLRKSRCWTEPPCSRIVFHTLVESLLFAASSFSGRGS
jgi:hypothetical protein